MVARRHGHRHPKQSRTYTAWANMKRRCTNAEGVQWKDYGARGITYDPRWEDFVKFLDDMGEAPPNLTLERKNNDRGYSKKNCLWDTRAAQRRNTRNIRATKLNGKRACLKDYCAAKGLNYSRVRTRLWRGRSFEEAIT